MITLARKLYHIHSDYLICRFTGHRFLIKELFPLSPHLSIYYGIRDSMVANISPEAEKNKQLIESLITCRS